MYKEFISPILDRLDSERWHGRAKEALHAAEATPFTLKLLEQFAYQRKRFRDDRLRVVLGGVEFDNPLVVGAGWDKSGRAVKGLYTLGFAGVEVGSVLEYPQAGNPKPRQFMVRRRKPLFVKIAPDLTDQALNDILMVVIDNGLAGIIATNTTTNPDIKAQYGEQWRNEPGGLSGDNPDFRRMSTQKIAHIYRATGSKLEIIGVGGVKDVETALEKIKAGAKVVQVVSSIRGEGTSLPGHINRGLVAYMEKEGLKSLDEIRGIAVK